MKKTKLLFTGLLLVALGKLSAQPVFSEDFNGASPLSNWTLFNVDGRTPAANVSAVNDAWVILSNNGEPGAFSTSWYSPAGQADDYMLTPSISITSNNYLFFDAIALDANFRDGYEVKISTTTPTVAALTTTLLTVPQENATLTRRAIDLRSYAGQSVHIAWRNNSNDQFILVVDNVLIREVLNNDAGIAELTIDDTQTNASTVNVTGVLENTGLSPLTSVVLNYSTDGGVTVFKDTLTTNVASFGTANFSHAITLTASNPGNFTDIVAWTSLPNNINDSLNGNDTMRTQFFVNNGMSASKNVLLEEFTTAPCQFCPDGAVIVEQILASNPAVIAVGEHACFGTDAMTIPEASTYCAAFGSAAPTANIDRVLFDGETEVAHGRGTWAANASSQSMLNTPVSVALSGSFNPTTLSTTVNVDANFVDYGLPGDLRVTLFVVEDSVTGTGSGYNQVNFYNTQAGHPYAGAGNPIVGFVHKHVLRDVYPANDAWGQAGVVPMNPQPNGTYSQNFTFNMNSSWKQKDISLVAFVSYYNTDASKREVLNVEEIKLNNLITGITEVESNEVNLSIFPNPTEGLSTVSFSLQNTENVTMELRDITGKLIKTVNHGRLAAGKHRLELNTSDVVNGIYFATFKIGNTPISRKISVVK